VTRRNSFNPEPIPWLTHEAWYLDRLSSPDCRLWVLEVGAEPIGQIRYDRTEPDAAQISFSIAPSFRHRNLGAKLLCLSTDLAGRELGVKYVQGVTFEDNVASVKAFKKAGFELAEQKKLAGHACLVFRRACRVKSVGDLGHVVY
jgi:RimJ/RimL family protein N-acetyltransferase